MRIAFEIMQESFRRILSKAGFPKSRAQVCADIFAGNSRDGVYSHGLNRFPVFLELVHAGLVDPMAEPVLREARGQMEIWDGLRGAGMYNARICMARAAELATRGGIGLVALRNSNHWMRGGTYGLQAAEAGCIGICFTNAIASMPPWGGREARLGNNPLVIAIPHAGSPILLDMAMSQFSYGKMQEYELEGKILPQDGGYDPSWQLTRDPAIIRKNKTALPIGFWKGSGLALTLDLLLAALAGGQSTASITASGKEVGLSQCFICIHPSQLHAEQLEEILKFTRSAAPVEPDGKISYPGERMMATRRKNLEQGIPVDPAIWERVLALPA